MERISRKTSHKGSFKNKVVWITGASSGIGEELAYAFAKKGARLILSARNTAALNAVRTRCSTVRGRIHVLPFDLSELDSLKKQAKQAWKIFGEIDYMIHNAGVALRDLAVNTTVEMDKKIMDTNYFGPVALTKALLKPMLRRGSGHFVVISSVSGKFGVPKLSAYSASKHALHGFFASLRAETSRDNIRSTLVVPGFVNTKITQNAFTGKGAMYGKMIQAQANGMSPSLCAQKILAGLRRNKEEVIMGGPEKLGVYCNLIFPGLFARIIRNHPVKKMEALKKCFDPIKYFSALGAGIERSFGGIRC